MLTAIIAAAAVIAAPAPNYNSWISPEISDTILQAVANNEYHEYLDYNGDGNLNTADAVCVALRYAENCTAGNEYTLCADTVRAIIAENYAEDAVSWEICAVNNEPCREYELTVSEITEAEIYVEFPESSEVFTLIVNPFEEVTVWKTEAYV